MRMWDLGFTSFGGPPVHFQILHRRFVEGAGFGGGSKWVDEQTVRTLAGCELRVSMTDYVLVSRDLCDLPGASWPRLYEDGLHDRDDTCRLRLGCIRFLTVELAGCHWHVRSVPRCTEDAGSTATNSVRIPKWNEREYGWHHRSSCRAGMLYDRLEGDFSIV